MTVHYQGQVSDAFPISVAEAAPGLFTLDSSGQGQAAALNQSGLVNTASTPAARGEVLALFGTGEGYTFPAGVDGRPASSPLPKPILPVTVWIGGESARIDYAGGAPSQIAGVIQINVQIPLSAPSGTAQVVMQVGESRSRSGVTISVR